MKMQPELEAINRYYDPCQTDSLEAYPALQVYQADMAAADTRHDHILRAALLASDRALAELHRQ